MKRLITGLILVILGIVGIGVSSTGMIARRFEVRSKYGGDLIVYRGNEAQHYGLLLLVMSFVLLIGGGAKLLSYLTNRDDPADQDWD